MESCESFVNLSKIGMTCNKSYQRYFIYTYFFIKIVAEGAYLNFVNKVIIMSIHNLSFQEKVKTSKIFLKKHKSSENVNL